MAKDNYAKLSPVVAIAGGTAAGTSGIVDTSGYKNMLLCTYGTTGSCSTSVLINGGTLAGTSETAFPQMIFLGSHKAVGVVGTDAVTEGYFKRTELTGLTNQAIVRHASITGTFTTTYSLYD